MPEVPRHQGPGPRIVVPERIGVALRPEIDRSGIPSRVSNNVGAPTYAGELREEQFGKIRGALPVGAAATVVALRRAWPLVGFCVHPGDAAGGGLTARLHVQVYGQNGFTPPVAVVSAGGPQVFFGFAVGAKCELIVTNATGAPIHNLRGSIWGTTQGGP